MVRRLTNEMWGFASNCFVCEPKNDAGLRIPFFADDDAGTVTGEFTLGEEFSGAPSYAHGGVVLAVLDEAMAWAAIALAGRWAVTGEITARFEAPVLVDRTYSVTARIEPGWSDKKLSATAVVNDADGTPCARAEATFVVLGEAQAVEATGGTVIEGYTTGD